MPVRASATCAHCSDSQLLQNSAALSAAAKAPHWASSCARPACAPMPGGRSACCALGGVGLADKCGPYRGGQGDDKEAGRFPSRRTVGQHAKHLAAVAGSYPAGRVDQVVAAGLGDVLHRGHQQVGPGGEVVQLRAA